MAGKLGKLMSSVMRTLGRKKPAKPPKPTPPSRPPTSSTPGSTRPTTSPSATRPPSPKPSSGAPTVDSVFAGVTVEYNPDLDGEADPGEVVWTWVPWEEDPTQGKDRPVVIVGRRGTKMLVGVPLTSKPHDNEEQVAVGTGPWDSQGRTSYAKIERVLDVDPDQIRREGSILGRRHFDDVIAALRRRG